MRWLDRSDVETLLSPDACLAAMERVMIALCRGEAIQPARTVIPLHAGRDSALFMPALLDRPAVLGTKVVTIYPDNHRHGVASHHGALLIFEAERGTPLALVEGSSLTAIRTAAVSALATRLLARPRSSVLAVLGTGVQARSHLTALTRVRDFREVRVWSPREASRRAFLEATRGQVDGARIIAVSSAEEAVRGADVVTTVTASGRPVVEAAWVRPGSHVNAVGASTATTRELDTETVAAARLFVDHREAALEEAGDLMIPVSEGRLDPSHVVAELGEVAAGTHPGRTGDDEVTIFKSVGLAVQDLAAAAVVIAGAESEGLGTIVDWG